jgi:glycosyltransferase involved in cell wall biosynthesis
MRIGINALYWLPGKVGGTETYLRNLLENLARIDKKNSYILFINPSAAGLLDYAGADFREVICNIPAFLKPVRVFWEQGELPRLAGQHKLDLLHSPGYTAPLRIDIPSIVTIHDMQIHYYPKNFSFAKRLFWKKLIPSSARKAACVIAPSMHTREDVIHLLGVHPDRVRLTYEGVSPRFKRETDERIREIKSKNRLPEKYVLCVATFNPHKNIDGLIRAYGLVREKLADKADFPHKLVLVGIKQRHSPAIQRTIQEQKLDNDVIITGHLDHEDLPGIYSGADVFVLPSFFEGFGLPVLEAMACGTPVVASDRTCLPEIVAEAGILVNPASDADIADGIIKVLTNLELAEQLRNFGYTRIKHFSWERMARQTLEIYEETYNENIRQRKS